MPGLSQREVADIMTSRGYPMNPHTVGVIERKALRLLRLLLADDSQVQSIIGPPAHFGRERLPSQQPAA